MPNEEIERGKLVHEFKIQTDEIREKNIEQDSVSVAWEIVRNKKKAEDQSESYNADPLDIIKEWVANKYEEWVYAFRNDKAYIRQVVKRARQLISDILEDIDHNEGKLVPLAPQAPAAPPGGGGGGGGEAGGGLGGLFGSSSEKMIKTAGISPFIGYIQKAFLGEQPVLDSTGKNFLWFGKKRNEAIILFPKNMEEFDKRVGPVNDENENIFRICMDTIVSVYGEDHPIRSEDINYIVNNYFRNIFKHVQAMTEGFTSLYLSSRDPEFVPKKIRTFAAELGKNLEHVNSQIMTIAKPEHFSSQVSIPPEASEMVFEIRPTPRVLGSSEIPSTKDPHSLLLTITSSGADIGARELAAFRLYHLISWHPDRFSNLDLSELSRLYNRSAIEIKSEESDLHEYIGNVLFAWRMSKANEATLENEYLLLPDRKVITTNNEQKERAKILMNVIGAKKMDGLVNRHPLAFMEMGFIPQKWIERLQPSQEVTDWAVHNASASQVDRGLIPVVIKLISESTTLAESMKFSEAGEYKIASILKLIESGRQVGTDCIRRNVQLQSIGNLEEVSTVTACLVHNWDKHRDGGLTQAFLHLQRGFGQERFQQFSPAGLSGIKNWPMFSKDNNISANGQPLSQTIQGIIAVIKMDAGSKDLDNLIDMGDSESLVQILEECLKQNIKTETFKSLLNIVYRMPKAKDKIDDMMIHYNFIMSEGSPLKINPEDIDNETLKKHILALSARPKQLGLLLVKKYYKDKAGTIRLLHEIEPLSPEIVNLFTPEMKTNQQMPSWVTGKKQGPVEAIIIRKKVTTG